MSHTDPRIQNALDRSYTADQPFVLTTVCTKVENAERTLKEIKRQAEILLIAIETARVTSNAVDGAVGALLDVSRSAGASGGLQSKVSSLTADAAFLQGLFESGVIRSAS